jgi:hypothetical protein
MLRPNLRGIYKDWSDGKATGDKETIKKAPSAQSASNAELCRYSANTRRIRCAALAYRHDILVDEYRPSKLKTVKRLLGVEQAVAVLQRELENPSIRNLLEAAKTPGRIRVAITDLKDLSARAEIARSSTELVGKSGRTKSGRGKPDVPDVFNAKALCAARIFEAWRLLNGRAPGISNLKAAEAAQAYWLAAGGASNGAGDPKNGWYDYFKVVRDNEMSPGLKRLIWRRDLEQCKRRGRAPWYLGTQFPVSEGEFRSPIPTE